MRRLPGTAQGRQITTDPLLETAIAGRSPRASGEELARIQTIRPPRRDLDFLPALGAAGPSGRSPGSAPISTAIPQPRPVLEWAIRWLETHLPEPLPPVLCHRDFRTGNYLLAWDGAPN